MLAVLVVTIRAASGGVDLSASMGPLDWDFSKSWASNIGLTGSVLTALLAGKVVASPVYLTDAAYSLLSVLFAVLIVAAPVVFKATSVPRLVAAGASGTTLQFQGTVWGFLTAATLTLWAVLGQFGVITTLFFEARRVNGLDASVVAVLMIVTILGALGVLTYAWVTIKPLIAYHANTETHKKNLQLQIRTLQPAGAPEPPTPEVQAALPTWSPL